MNSSKIQKGEECTIWPAQMILSKWIWVVEDFLEEALEWIWKTYLIWASEVSGEGDKDKKEEVAEEEEHSHLVSEEEEEMVIDFKCDF